MDSYYGKIVAVVKSILKTDAVAEDIAQEVFVTAFLSIKRFNEKCTLYSWLYRIAVNKCIDELRKAKVRPTKLNYSTTDTTFVAPNSSNALAENKELQQYLHEALHSLPEQQQTAFILWHFEQLPQKDIAAIMGLNLKAWNRCCKGQNRTCEKNYPQFMMIIIPFNRES